MDSARSVLLAVDFQGRLMPAIKDGRAVLANARRLIDAAALLGIPAFATEQNPRGLGASVAEIAAGALPTLHKMSFDATQEADFGAFLPADRPEVVVVGCEAHVCVMQTVLGLLRHGRSVFLARDAVGSRRSESKETAIARMARAGAEIVTVEMTIFEWLGTCEHPRFREVLALVR
jgi:nicotinamidase-related amidase